MSGKGASRGPISRQRLSQACEHAAPVRSRQTKGTSDDPRARGERAPTASVPAAAVIPSRRFAADALAARVTRPLPFPIAPLGLNLPHERRAQATPRRAGFDPPESADDPEREDASPPLELALEEAPAEPGSLARGAAVIKSFWRHAPLGPGVYRMIGADGEVLYVGKARSIKKRVAGLHDAGAAVDPHRPHGRRRPASMVFVTTETEAEALLLEANLIKQLKPRYNVLLRDDKSFPYILITGGHEAPQLDQASRRAHRSRATISARSPAPAR